MKREYTCHHCGKSFQRYPSQVTGTRHFCNRVCLGAWKTTQTDAKANRWNGGTRRDRQRVTLHLPWHHLADSHGYVARSRIVAELKLHRDLLPEEIVHHLDGDQTNDHPDNLLVLPNQSAHARLHGLMRSSKQMATMRAARS